jgi:pSer/pThr/pTyr-binding forkhead associated (FHA) protein
MPKIEILSGKREGEVVELPPDGIDIGNRKTAKLSIRDPWISWNHAKIVPEEGRFVIEDLGSSNGTWINGKKVTRQPLAPEEVIFLGKTKIRFVEIEPTEHMPVPPDLGRIRPEEPTLRVSPPASASEDHVEKLEQENAELKKMKEVLERFLDLTTEERAAVGRASGVSSEPSPPPVGAASDSATEKARREAVTKLVEVEGKLAAAEAQVRDLEGRAKDRGDHSKKEIEKARTKFEEELAFARVAKTEAETARDRAEEKLRELSKKKGDDAAAAASSAELDKLKAEVERLKAETDKAKAALGDAISERDEWKTKHDAVREEIDKISMDQIEIEESLQKRIDELEAKLKKS